MKGDHRPAPADRLLLALALLLSACVAVPVIDHRAPVPCPLVTRQLTLTVVEMQGAYRCQRTEECLASVVVGSALFAASTLVSGSVVIVGNTLHWMERNSRCTNQVFTPPEATAGTL